MKDLLSVLKVLFGFTFISLLVIYQAWWLTILWDISATIYFGVEALTLAQAVTVTFVLALLKLGTKSKDSNQFSEDTLHTLIKPPVVVGLFWLISNVLF